MPGLVLSKHFRHSLFELLLVIVATYPLQPNQYGQGSYLHDIINTPMIENMAFIGSCLANWAVMVLFPPDLPRSLVLAVAYNPSPRNNTLHYAYRDRVPPTLV